VSSGALWQEVLQWYREGHVLTCATPDDDDDDGNDDNNDRMYGKDSISIDASNNNNKVCYNTSGGDSALLSESVQRLSLGHSQEMHSTKSGRSDASPTPPPAAVAVGGWSGVVSGHAYAVSACVEVRARVLYF